MECPYCREVRYSRDWRPCQYRARVYWVMGEVDWRYWYLAQPNVQATMCGRQLKGDSSWERGVFLGKVNESDEFLVGNAKGVHSVRTVRRLEEKLRWNTKAITTMRGVPWNRETTIGRPRKADLQNCSAAGGKPEKMRR
eukprot:s1590_g33.t1